VTKLPDSDQEITATIATLHAAIESWARTKDLWLDCGFKTYDEHVDAEPISPAAVSLLWFEGPLSYWDGSRLYSPWDGRPAHFNRAD
jgi:hypothetical protein